MTSKPTSDRISEITWRWVQGELEPADLTEFARDLLEQGYDSRALRQLAGGTDSQREADQLFKRAMGDLQIELPSPREALLKGARRDLRVLLDSGDVWPHADEIVWGDCAEVLSPDLISTINSLLLQADDFVDDNGDLDPYNPRTEQLETLEHLLWQAGPDPTGPDPTGVELVRTRR